MARRGFEAGAAGVLPDLVEDRDGGLCAGVGPCELHRDVGGGDIGGERRAAVHFGRRGGRDALSEAVPLEIQFADQRTDGKRVPRFLQVVGPPQPLGAAVPRHGVRDTALGHGRLAGLEMDGGGEGRRPVAGQASGEAAVRKRCVEFRDDVHRCAERQLHCAARQWIDLGHRSEPQHVRSQPVDLFGACRLAAVVRNDHMRKAPVDRQFERFAVDPAGVSPGHAGQRAPGVREATRRCLRGATRESQARFSGGAIGQMAHGGGHAFDALAQPQPQTTGVQQDAGGEVLVAGRRGMAHRVDDVVAAREGLRDAPVHFGMPCRLVATQPVGAVSAHQRVETRDLGVACAHGAEQAVELLKTVDALRRSAPAEGFVEQARVEPLELARDEYEVAVGCRQGFPEARLDPVADDVARESCRTDIAGHRTIVAVHAQGDRPAGRRGDQGIDPRPRQAVAEEGSRVVGGEAQVVGGHDRGPAGVHGAGEVESPRKLAAGDGEMQGRRRRPHQEVQEVDCAGIGQAFGLIERQQAGRAEGLDGTQQVGGARMAHARGQGAAAPGQDVDAGGPEGEREVGLERVWLVVGVQRQPGGGNALRPGIPAALRKQGRLAEAACCDEEREPVVERREPRGQRGAIQESGYAVGQGDAVPQKPPGNGRRIAVRVSGALLSNLCRCRLRRFGLSRHSPSEVAHERIAAPGTAESSQRTPVAARRLPLAAKC